MRTFLMPGLAAALSLAALPAAAADYYQCRDAEGTMIFSDTPCPADAEVLRERVIKDEAPAKEAAGETNADPGEDVAQAPKRAPGAEEQPRVEGALLTAEVLQAMASLTPLRARLVQFHDSQGRWPRNLGEIGLDQATMKSSRIDSIEFGVEGKIIAYLPPRLGVNRRIMLDPIPALGGTQYEWRCVANYPQEVLHDGLRNFCESGPVEGAPVAPLSTATAPAEEKMPAPAEADAPETDKTP